MALFKRKANKPGASKKTDAVKAKQLTPGEKPKRRSWTPRFLRKIGGYFAGAWNELSQVRWPNRKATWSLTVAVILFTVFIMVFILLLDNFFGWVFEQLVL